MPRSNRFIWQILPYHIIIVLVSFFTVALYAAGSLRDYCTESTRADLVAKALLFSRLLSQKTMMSNPAKADSLCKEVGPLLADRFTVILPSGRVIGDSEADPSRMENHADRPEFQRALKGETSTIVRFSYTLHKRMLYAAVPIRSKAKIVGVVRISLPSTAMNQTLVLFYRRILIGGFLLVILALVFSAGISRRLNGTFTEIRRGADRFSSGDLEHRLHIHSFAEIDGLAENLNDMADRINMRIRAITGQRNELEAVLSSMMEAVIAVDLDEHLINCNHAAESLFGFTLDSARGRTIQEIIRNSHLQSFIKKVLASAGQITEDTILHFRPDRFLQAHGSLLRDARGRSIGALIVLNDITRLKTLENIRRDFVANVSHELKTPITSIKGFVETLLDGAADDPPTARRFLDIILKHTDRLNSIIEDLLSLSRIEQDAENETVHLEMVRAEEIVKNALLICDRQIREKNIAITVSCDENISITGNPALLEQAVVNLLDNAVKYSPPGSGVLVGVARDEREISISVEDNGVGIPEKYLTRIFERFYRVDKARSRDMGGTGLGLAIVKHITQAHNGYVTVASTPGKGSVFTLHLPAHA